MAISILNIVERGLHKERCCVSGWVCFGCFVCVCVYLCYDIWSRRGVWFFVLCVGVVVIIYGSARASGVEAEC